MRSKRNVSEQSNSQSSNKAANNAFEVSPNCIIERVEIHSVKLFAFASQKLSLSRLKTVGI